MNYKKIGEYIANKRKEKNLTQQELADKMHVSVKAISKWECGKGIPEISNLQILAKNLDVSIIDILNGKDSKKEDVVVEYVKKENKKKNTKIWFLTCLILLLVILFAFGLYFVNNYNKIYAYRLSGESEHFSFDSGFVLASNYNNIISTGNLRFKDREYEKKFYITSIDFICNDKRIMGSNALIDKTFLNIEKSGYNDLLKDRIDEDSKLVININYIYDNQVVNEKVELNKELVFKNNKILNTKEEKNSEELENDNEEVKVDAYTDNSLGLKLRNFLINENGFEAAEDTIGFVYKYNNDKNGKPISRIYVYPFVGKYQAFYYVGDIEIVTSKYLFYYPTNEIDQTEFLILQGSYPKKIKEDVDNKISHDKKYFTSVYYYKNNEAKCESGNCSDKVLEYGKQAYSDYKNIKEYVEKEAK